MRNQAIYERQYRKVLKPIFRDQRAEAKDNLEAHAGSLTKAFDQKLFDDAAADQAMIKALNPTLIDLSQTQGGLALVFAGDDKNEFHMTSNVLAHIEQGTQRMASKFNDDTLTKLNQELAQGVQNGEGLGELKKRVDKVYDGVEGYRAERVARTETLKASNAASVEAYRQTGFVTGKAWVVNPNACPQCIEFEGKTIGLDDAFLGLGESYSVTGSDGETTSYTNSYDDVEEPPLHPNCECTVIPVTQEFAGGDGEPEVLGDKDVDPITVFHGESGEAFNSDSMLGNAFYVSRSRDTAGMFGNVKEYQLGIKAEDLLIINSQDEYQALVNKVVAKYPGEDTNTSIPKYIQGLGYRAAEVAEDFDPLGGIAIYDKKLMPK